MTHGELLIIERDSYLGSGKELLNLALEYLNDKSRVWDMKCELNYMDLIYRATSNLNKAIAIEDILKKLGVEK